jgi:hypothetical protein
MRSSALLIVPFIVLCAAGSWAAAAEPETVFDKCRNQSANKDRYRIAFKREAEVEELVEWMASVSCQKFVWSTAVRGGKVNVVAPEPLTFGEAAAIFHSALRTMRLAAEPGPGYFRIVELKDAPQGDFAIYGASAPVPDDDRIVTKIVQLQASWRADAIATFEALKTDGDAVALAVKLPIGEVVKQDASQLHKGDVVVAFAQSLIVIGDHYTNAEAAQALAVAQDMVPWLQTAYEALGDDEIAEMRDLMNEYAVTLAGS